MTAPEPFLDRIAVATPCSASWDDMAGDDRSRFCGDCKLHVYNLSAMTRGEAESLLRTATDRVCTRFFRRADGTVVTRDCGPLRAAIQRRLRRLRVAATALFGFLAAFTTAGCGRADAPPPETPAQAQPEPSTGLIPEELLGDVCLPEDVYEEALGRMLLPIPDKHPEPEGK